MTEGVDGAAETIRSKKGKKKGKKRRTSSKGFGNKSAKSSGILTEGEDDYEVKDLDNDNKSIKSGRSGRSLGKKKKRRASV
jgi:hypothetical protein